MEANETKLERRMKTHEKNLAWVVLNTHASWALHKPNCGTRSTWYVLLYIISSHQVAKVGSAIGKVAKAGRHSSNASPGNTKTNQGSRSRVPTGKLQSSFDHVVQASSRGFIQQISIVCLKFFFVDYLIQYLAHLFIRAYIAYYIIYLQLPYNFVVLCY